MQSPEACSVFSVVKWIRNCGHIRNIAIELIELQAGSDAQHEAGDKMAEKEN